MKKITAVLTSAVLLLCLFTGSAFASESRISSKQVKQEAQATAAYVMEALLEPAKVSYLYQNGEMVAAAAQTGIDCIELKEAYSKAFQDRLDENGGRLPDHTDNSGYYAWGIIALEALGMDAADFAGYNLFKLFEASAAVNSNLYNNCTALTMVRNHKEKFSNPTALETLFLQAVIETFKENTDASGAPADFNNAGWFYWGISVDNNGTVISALAPYYNTDANVKEQIDKALEWIATMKQETGYASDLEYITNPNANSTGVMLKAFSDLGHFEKAIEAYELLAQYRSETDGAYTVSGDVDLYASKDALGGLNAFAAMLEKQEAEEDTTTAPEETTVLEQTETTAPATTSATRLETTTSVHNNAGKTTPSTGDSAMLIAIPAAFCVISAAGVLALTKRKTAES